MTNAPARMLAPVALLGLSVVVAPGFAQANRGQAPQPARSYHTELKALADEVGKHYKVRIAVDPSIFVPAPPKQPTEAETVDPVVNSLVSGLKNVAWRKVYVPQGEASAQIAPERLAAMVRALDTLETGGLVLENPSTRRAISYQKNLPVVPGFSDELQARQFSPAPIYVIYSTVGGGQGRTPEDRFLDLQRQQMEMMMEMDPEALAETFAKGMQMWMSLDPQTRSGLFTSMMRAGTQMFMNMDPQMRTEMVGTMMRSGIEMWSNMPEAQRQKLMQDMMQMGQQLSGQAGGPAQRRP